MSRILGLMITVAAALLIAVLTPAFRHAPFVELVWERLVEFGAPIAATAVAIYVLSVVTIVIGVWRKRAARPAEPVSVLVEQIWEAIRSPRETRRRAQVPTHRRRLLNVHCRLKDGTLFERNFVPVMAHNGTGSVYQIDHGVFFGCDAEHVDVGSHLTVCVGPRRFELTVKWDDAKQVPYLLIPHTRQELIALLDAPAT
jgi:hypothetical protein